MNVLKLLQPNKLNLGIFLLVGLLLSITPYGIQATTKITWDEYHGFPFTFLRLAGCSGPCGANRIIPIYDVQEINFYAIILNIIAWYAIACLVGYGIDFVTHKEKIRAIVTDRK